MDQFSRECPLLEADRSLTGKHVVECLDRLAWLHGKPESITVDNGSEFCSRALDAWAYQNGVRLDLKDSPKASETTKFRYFPLPVPFRCLQSVDKHKSFTVFFKKFPLAKFLKTRRQVIVSGRYRPAPNGSP